MTVAEKIKHLRTTMGITQDELATSLNGQPTVGGI